MRAISLAAFLFFSFNSNSYAAEFFIKFDTWPQGSIVAYCNQVWEWRYHDAATDRADEIAAVKKYWDPCMTYAADNGIQNLILIRSTTARPEFFAVGAEMGRLLPPDVACDVPNSPGCGTPGNPAVFALPVEVTGSKGRTLPITADDWLPDAENCAGEFTLVCDGDPCALGAAECHVECFGTTVSRIKRMECRDPITPTIRGAGQVFDPARQPDLRLLPQFQQGGTFEVPRIWVPNSGPGTDPLPKF